MLARTPSTVRLIGAGLTSLGAAAAFIFAPAGTKAQTLMASVDDQRAGAMAVCDIIPNPTERVGCRAQRSIEFDNARTAAAKQRIETAEKATAGADQVIASEQQLQRCTAFLKGKRDSGVVFDRQITRQNVCPYARELGMKDGPG